MKKIILFLFISLLISCNNNIKKDITVKIPLKDTIVDYTIKIPENISNDSNIYLGEVISLKELKTKSLYKVNCKFCHGETGKGDGIKSKTNPNICPHDLTKISDTDQTVYYIILNGKNDMPSHSKKIEEDKIKMLVIYIKKLKID